jgi:hypothetical protein
MARRYDLLGDRYAIRRGISWRLAVRRLQPLPGHPPVDMAGMTAQFEIYDVFVDRAPWVFDVNITAAQYAEIALSAAETADIDATEVRYRLVFTDSLGDAQVLLYGRLAILEPTL